MVGRDGSAKRFLLAGYQQVGQFLYVVGGFEASGPVKPWQQQSSVLYRGQQSKQPKVPMANNTTTWRLDMSSAPGVWTTGPAFTKVGQTSAWPTMREPTRCMRWVETYRVVVSLTRPTR